MDPKRFDALARLLTTRSSRRTIGGLLTSGFTLSTFGDATARTRRKRCGPCRRKRHGHCKRKKPDGTSCDDRSACRSGSCQSLLAASCSASNDFCAQQWTHCLESLTCGCFVSVEGNGFCGNTEPQSFTGCPTTTSCTSSAECPNAGQCANLSCCPEGKAVCVPLCVPPA